jgi:hypothetical protein
MCLIKHHVTKTYGGRGSIASRVFNLGARWRWVVSFTPGEGDTGVEIDLRALTAFVAMKSFWYSVTYKIGN